MTVVQTSNIGNTLQGSLGAPAVGQPVAPLVQNAPAGSLASSSPLASANNGTKAATPQISTVPNTTIPSSAQKTTDVSDKYANVNGTIWNTTTNTPYNNEQEFFKDSGYSSFNGLKFADNYTPPASNNSAPSSSNPAPSSSTPSTPSAPAWQPGDTPTNQQQAIANESYYAQLSPEEQTDTQALTNLDSSAKAEAQNMDLVGGPTRFVTGAEAAIQNLAAIQEAPYQTQLAIAQANRQAKEAAATSQAGQLAPIQVSPGNEAVSPTTGAVIANQPSYSATVNPSTGALSTVNQTTGQVNNNYGGNSGTTYGSASTANGLLGVGATQNNPTGLKDPSTGNFATYPTVQAGLQAAAQQFQLYQTGQSSSGLTGSSTLNQAIAKWNNNSSNYNGDSVAQTLQSMGVSGVTGNTPISQLDPNQVAEAIASHETGYNPGSSSSQYGPIISSAVQSVLQGVPVESLGLSQAQESLVNQQAKQQNASYNPATNTQNFSALSSAKQTAVTQAVQKKTAIIAADNTLDGTLQQMATLADKVNLSNVPKLDQWLNGKITDYSNDPDLVEFKSLWNNAKTQYAIISSGGNQTPDQGDLDSAQGYIPMAGNSSVYSGLSSTLSNTAQREAQSQQEVIDSEIGTSAGSGGTATGSGNSSNADVSKYLSLY